MLGINYCTFFSKERSNSQFIWPKQSFLLKVIQQLKKYLKRKDHLSIDERERTLSTKLTGGNMNQTLVNKLIRNDQMMMQICECGTVT